jgi:hypothetical protein
MPDRVFDGYRIHHAPARIDGIGGERGEQNVMNYGYPSVLGILILRRRRLGDINIFQSSVSNEKKLLWILVVALLPVLGLILWFFLGPRNGKT